MAHRTSPDHAGGNTPGSTSIAKVDVTHVLAATDLEHGTLAALAWARRIAQRFGAHLTVLHCVPSTDINEGEWIMAPPAAYEAQLRDRLRSHAEPSLHNWPCDLAVTVGLPAPNIVRIARERGADLIVVGNSAVRGVRAFLGSCTVGVVQESACPVLAARTEPAAVERILCPVDLQGIAADSLHLALRFAEAFSAELIVVHVVEAIDQAERAHHERIVRAWVTPELQNVVSYREVIVHGRADERLLACAEDFDASLIVIGSRRGRMTPQTAIGTTAERFLAEAASPVLIVPSSHEGRETRCVDLP